jgi:hypothetical protein
MKQQFTASIRGEGDWHVAQFAQCLEIDVGSYGETEDEALSSLREVLELYFAPPTPTERPHIRSFEVERRGVYGAGRSFAYQEPAPEYQYTGESDLATPWAFEGETLYIKAHGSGRQWR